MLKKRIFICADVKFPKEDPGANRIQYMAKALIAAGNEVIIISCGKNDSKLAIENGLYDFSGIAYKNITMHSDKIRNAVDKKLLSGKKMVNSLIKLNIKKDDIVYLYGTNSLFIKPLMKFCKKRSIKTFIDVVEWHQPFQYKFGKYDIRYISSNKTFEKHAVKIGNVVCISECLADYYKNRGCNTAVFPVLFDETEQETDLSVREKAKIDLVYPGNPTGKDDIYTMLSGLEKTDKKSLERLCFHITGVSEGKIRSHLGERQGIIDRLGRHICFHGWLDYEELVEIYKNADFLYMSRPDNLVTQANFPSKLPELMAWGIVPLCNRVGDYYKYLNDGEDSILFDNDTAEECAAALIRAVNTDTVTLLSMRKNARKTAVSCFDYNGWIEKTDRFIG